MECPGLQVLLVLLVLHRNIRLMLFLCPSFPAEVPLDDLVKMYEGAFAESFHWPKPKTTEEDTSEEGTLLVPSLENVSRRDLFACI